MLSAGNNVQSKLAETVKAYAQYDIGSLKLANLKGIRALLDILRALRTTLVLTTPLALTCRALPIFVQARMIF